MYQSYYRLGQIAALQKEYELARQYYFKALEINPGYLPVQEELATIEGY